MPESEQNSFLMLFFPVSVGKLDFQHLKRSWGECSYDITQNEGRVVIALVLISNDVQFRFRKWNWNRISKIFRDCGIGIGIELKPKLLEGEC